MIKPDIDLYNIIKEINYKSDNTYHDKVLTIKSILTDSINFLFKIYQKNNPISFNNLINKEVISISFVAFENHLPFNEVLYWEIKPLKNSWEVVGTLMTSNQIPREMALGHQEAIDSFIIRNPNYYEQFDNYKAKHLIEIQSRSTPLWVGLPIDILNLDEKGHKWIQRQNSCD